MKEQGQLPIANVLGWMMQACDALIEAHDQGILHRDLKPQNLFLTTRPSGEEHVHVLDFGLAKLFDRVDSLSPQHLTRPGEVIGTSHYMAPEQLREGHLDERTDVWGAGVCLFRLLSQTYPSAAPNPALVCSAILSEEPGALREIRPEVPEAVEVIVKRCLRKDPGERFANMRELLLALQKARVALDLEDNAPTVKKKPVPQVATLRLGARSPVEPMPVGGSQRLAPPVQTVPPPVRPTPGALIPVTPGPVPPPAAAQGKTNPSSRLSLAIGLTALWMLLVASGIVAFGVMRIKKSDSHGAATHLHKNVPLVTSSSSSSSAAAASSAPPQSDASQ
jgi:serine/threonine-protein kinase